MQDAEPMRNKDSNLSRESLGDFGEIHFVAEKNHEGTIVFLNIIVAGHDSIKIIIKKTATHKLLLALIQALHRTSTDRELILYGSLTGEEISQALTSTPSMKIQNLHLIVSRTRGLLPRGLTLVGGQQGDVHLMEQLFSDLMIGMDSGLSTYTIIWNLTFLLEEQQVRRAAQLATHGRELDDATELSSMAAPVAEYYNYLLTQLTADQLSNWRQNSQKLAEAGIHFTGRTLLIGDSLIMFSGLDAQLFTIAWCRTVSSVTPMLAVFSKVSDYLSEVESDSETDPFVADLMRRRTDPNLIRLSSRRVQKKIRTIPATQMEISQ